MIELPTRYVHSPAYVIYSDESPALKDTYLKILGLAWQHDYQYTDSLLVEDLIAFLRLARRTYFLHIEKLTGLSWLRSETPRIGCVRFRFPVVRVESEFS